MKNKKLFSKNRTLEALNQRRLRFGSLGALDFLIAYECVRISGGKFATLQQQFGVNSPQKEPYFQPIEKNERKGNAVTRGRSGGSKVDTLYNLLLGFGFTDAPLAELELIARTTSWAGERTKSLLYLALWHMQMKTREGYFTALRYLPDSSEIQDSTTLKSEVTTARLICLYHLGDAVEAERLRSGLKRENGLTPNVLLALTNFQRTPEARVAGINQALAHYNIPELSLRADGDHPPYDRLQMAAPVVPVCYGPRVTVLVAAYEAADTLSTTLRSLQEQSWKNLEIIVLDDHSPSLDTVAVAECFAQEDSRFKVVRMPKNGGAYVARNYGLDLATGEFVTLNDADDWSHPLKIETQVRFLLSNPKVIACTSEQARSTSSLSFIKFRGKGQVISSNMSSLMFRRRSVVNALGYWDTVRFGADSEFVKRIRHVFDINGIVNLETGPLSFQRDSEAAVTNDEFFGWKGVPHGVRRIYLEMQRSHHTKSTFKYDNSLSKRPFPVPRAMLVSKAEAKMTVHFDVVIASEFRMEGGSTHSNAQEIACQSLAGLRTAILPMFRYDFDRKKNTSPLILNLIDGALIQVIAYGEAVCCDLLILRYPPILFHRLRYMPKIEAKEIRVIVNQTPMSDYGPNGVVRYKLEQCAENIRHYFGKDAIWHPIGPQVRDALIQHHASELKFIQLSEQDWHNIIDIEGWDRGTRKRGSHEKLRIGRHSRDHAHKWPENRKDILAAYPDSDDLEVHVLGGARTPSSILGGLPNNWVVHEFGGLHPKDFLADIDVFIYYTNSGWVESFGRVIIEAMAVGVPVVLPEIYRPLFKDAAMYAAPQKAVALARKLHKDERVYAQQVEIARNYVRKNFSYESHLQRLKQLGVRG